MSHSVLASLGVLICTQDASASLNVVSLRDFLAGYKRKVTVAMTDELCNDPRILQAFIRKNRLQRVVVGCRSGPEWRGFLQEQLVEAGLSPLNLELFDLVSASKDPELKTRIGAIIELNLHRLLTQPTIPAENMRRRPLISSSGIGRREFLTGRRPATYEIVPNIELAICRSDRGCRECIKACPHQALRVDDRKRIRLTVEKCESCGLCIPACPTEAIVFPNLKPELMAGDFKILAQYDRRGMAPRVLALICSKRSDEAIIVPKGVMTLTVTSEAVVEPSWILKAIEAGFEGVCFIPCEDSAAHGRQIERLKEVIQFTQTLLSHWGENPERIQRSPPPTGKDDQSFPWLQGFFERISALGKPKLYNASDENWFNLRSLIASASYVGKNENLVFTAKYLTFGRLQLDENRCTLCGLCSQSCPTEAISIRENSDCELWFNQSRCTACGLCLASCPERALTVERIFDLQKFLNESQDRIAMSQRVRCPSCGRPHVPAVMVDKVFRRLERRVPSPVIQSTIMLCEECKGGGIMRQAAAILQNG